MNDEKTENGTSEAVSLTEIDQALAQLKAAAGV
jgi:hypothetical protein